MKKRTQYKPPHWHNRYYDPLQRTEQPDKRPIGIKSRGPRCVKSIRHQRSENKHSTAPNPYQSTAVIVRVDGGAERGFASLDTAKRWLKRIPVSATVSDSTGRIVHSHTPATRVRTVTLRSGSAPKQPIPHNDNPSLLYGV